MHIFRSLRICVFTFTFAVVILAGLIGCGSGQSGSGRSTAFSEEPQLAGNWAFAAPAGTGSQPALRLNAGFTAAAAGAKTAGGTVAGVAHLSGSACIPESAGIALSGSVATNGSFVLSSLPVAGTTVTLKGTLAANGRTVSAATLNLAGGNCGSAALTNMAGTQYTDIAGTYAGSFSDTDGNSIPVTATLTQTTQPDANGQFHLAGSANFANSPCFTSPVLTDSLVTGSSLSTTYTAAGSGGSSTITGVGTFNTDATQLTVTSWQVAGGACDGEMGTGLLTKQ